MKAMHMRIFVLLVALMALVCAMGMTAMAAQTDPAEEPVCYEHGDVNSDGDITGDDAIYLLFASFGDMFGSEYPLAQDGDLDGDGTVTGNDAVYLLFASYGDLFGDQYPLKGTIHNYYDPIWTWDTQAAEPTATVSLKCACGQPHTVTEGITVTAGTVVEPTCVAAGSKEFTAKVTFEGVEYENTLQVTQDALGENGHQLSGEPTCTQGVKCANCDYEEPALGHSYTVSGEKVEGCEHTKLLRCACGHETEGDVYYTHTFSSAELVEEATCSKDGKKLLKCACGETQEETIPQNAEYHKWVEGDTVEGVAHFTCEHNAQHTKTMVVMSDEGVSADALKESEVKLDGGTSVTLDSAVADQLSENKTVVIQVEQVHKDQTNMSEADKDQLPGDMVYDFTMKYSDGSAIDTADLGGEVTVVLPYTLREGDDVNAIDVWFIADDGSVECVKGVYSNGYVTFTTTHFSYYTVTRLTAAQRCAIYGHDMVERTKAPTCTDDGYHKVFCQRCGHEELDEVKEMLGHDYQKNEAESVDATCDAPGKLVSVCGNCNHKKLQELKQLTHQWKSQTVAPTCSANGYELLTCTLCEAEKVINEKEALGHSYPAEKAQWTWSDDHSKATVTLVCKNDETHTKELTAVVSSKGGSVCVGGTATYTATVSLNKVTYTDTTTGTYEGAGHTPDTKWESGDDKHYHLCTVCGEKVGQADHAWERKVNTAATCAKDGSATDTCTVCGKVKTVVLPATGKHNFYYGTCTVCGYKEGSCDHETLTEIKYNLADYGACEGYIVVRACACGQRTIWEDSEFGCDFVDTEKVDEDTYYAEYTSTCKTCGLVGVGKQYLVQDEAACSAYAVFQRKFTKGATVIVDQKEESEPYNHLVTVKKAPVNLADYGLCPMTVTVRTCACGLNSRLDVEGEGCQMETEDDVNFLCSVCGATGKAVSSTKKEGCTSIESHTATFYRNGVEVHSLTESYVRENHKYELADYKLLGETCEDGLTVNWLCTVCGKTRKEQTSYCRTILVEKTIDTSATDSCSTAIEISTCPCGRTENWNFVFDGQEEDHLWNGRYDPELDMWVEYCEKCGFTIDSESTAIDESTKDENCRVYYTRTYTYANGEGQEFTWEVDDWELYHNSVYTFELDGESCEDGVKVIRTCADCGQEDTWTEDYHSRYPVEKLDLSQYGLCSGTVYVFGCPCGQEGDIEFENYECNWYGRAGDEGFEERYCDTCGIVWQTRWEEVETDVSCMRVYDYTATFLKDDEILGQLSYCQREVTHRYVYELALNEGAEVCGDGYNYVATCLECGETYENEGYGCSSYEVSRELIEGMCGQAELVHERCACGKNDQTSVVWYGREACDFHSGGVYNETYGAWQYFCAGCGSSRILVSQTAPVPGQTCRVEERTIQYYLAADGSLICETVYSRAYYSHHFLVEYQLQGETCDDGWTYTRRCADCGLTESVEEVRYGCSGNLVDRELVYDAEDICGPVYLYRHSCACGELSGYDLDYECNMHWVGNECVCPDCGLTRVGDPKREEIYGSCKVIVSYNYSFLKNGEVVGVAAYEQVQYDHEIIYELILLGETCEDGYKAIQHCAYCDYEYIFEEVEYGHDTYTTAHYDLPEEACGGFVTVSSCACGKQVRLSYNDYDCQLGESYDEVIDANGIRHNIRTATCTVCGLKEVQDYYYEMGEQECQLRCYQDYTWTLGDWELHLTGDYDEHNPEWYITKAELMEGSETCYDGVILTEKCRHCGLEEEYYSSYHGMAVTETVDLAQYGSVCGAKLELLACACGAEKDARFSHDTQCDMGSNYIDHFIEGVLDYKQYYTANGWESIYSDSYERYCAVTDPQCGLRIRMARYYVNENCQAVEYETWQLGYDPETGSFQREITFATGEVAPYHPYEEVDVADNTADGVRTVETKRVCPDCGSSWTETYYYDAETGNTIKNTRKVVNTLEDGRNKEHTQINEYVLVKDILGNTENRQSLYYNQYVYSDGTVYWHQNEYIYDFSGECKRTRIYTDSMGERFVEEDEPGHRGYQIGETVEQPTCTQTGLEQVTVICRYCEKVMEEWTNTIYPNDHSWYWTDNGAYCTVCGLENTNGTSGAIWMEDLSNDTHYIVGYYNSGDVEFSPYVSLILYDAAEGEDDQLVLDSIQVTYLTKEADGVCGLKFEKAATLAAAAQALKAAGYTGTYAVRISCVPVGGSGNLDYAVTFDKTCTSHNYVSEKNLIEGAKTCEDGVVSTSTCTGCGDTSTDTFYIHIRFPEETLDLSQYGFCGGAVKISACTCSEFVQVSGTDSCNWQWTGGGVLEGGGQFHIEQCTVCNIVYRQESVPVESDDPNLTIWQKNYIFTQGTETLGSLSIETKEYTGETLTAE